MTNNSTRREHLSRLGLLAGAALLPACQGTPAREWLAEKAATSRRDSFAAVQDKPLVDALYVMTADGRTETLVRPLLAANYALQHLRPEVLALRSPMGNGGDMRGAREIVDRYVPDVDKDLVAQLYLQVAKGRGNLVKVYKPRMGARLNSLFQPPMVMGPGRVEWYDRDNALIEWTPQGRVVSVVVYAFQAAASLGVLVTRYTAVRFGPETARHVENSIRNSEFADLELRTL